MTAAARGQARLRSTPLPVRRPYERLEPGLSVRGYKTDQTGCKAARSAPVAFGRRTRSLSGILKANQARLRAAPVFAAGAALAARGLAGISSAPHRLSSSRRANKRSRSGLPIGDVPNRALKNKP